MTLNEYQALAQRTSNTDTPEPPLHVAVFAERLILSGCYIGEDGHLYGKHGRQISRKGRNGYYTVRKEIGGRPWCFMEHRVIWAWFHPDMDDSLVINHLDSDRSNNRIDNLELVTQKENIAHAKRNGRLNPAKGEQNGKACITNTQAKTMRYLHNIGYPQNVIAKMMGVKNNNTISRVVHKKRYASVSDAESVFDVYPEFVRIMTAKGFTTKERISEATMGLCGEAGEVLDMVKKFRYQGHELDADALIDELGDVLFYLTMLMNEINVDIADLVFWNVDKLRRRYPDGFEVERSIHREE